MLFYFCKCEDSFGAKILRDDCARPRCIFYTSNMRHLFVVGEFVVVSHLKIFPLQLLGPADKPMAGPSSSKGKILR